MTVERRPGRVPDEDWPPAGSGYEPGPGESGVGMAGADGPHSGGPPAVTRFDTDGDGRADTTVTDDGVDLVLLTDLDGDGLADQVLRIGPDGVVREMAPEHPPVAAGDGVVDGLLGGAGAGFEPG